MIIFWNYFRKNILSASI